MPLTAIREDVDKVRRQSKLAVILFAVSMLALVGVSVFVIKEGRARDTERCLISKENRDVIRSVLLEAERISLEAAGSDEHRKATTIAAYDRILAKTPKIESCKNGTPVYAPAAAKLKNSLG